MKYAHKFVHYSKDFGYKVELIFAKWKMDSKGIRYELKFLCKEDGNEEGDELIIEPFGDSKIKGSTMKIYKESTGEDDWFWCYCGNELVHDTIQERLDEEMMHHN